MKTEWQPEGLDHREASPTWTARLKLEEAKDGEKALSPEQTAWPALKPARTNYFVSGSNKQPTQRMETATSTYHMAPSTGSSDLCQELLDHRNSSPLPSPMSTPLAAAQMPPSFSKSQYHSPQGSPLPPPRTTWNQRTIRWTGESFGVPHRREQRETDKERVLEDKFFSTNPTAGLHASVYLLGCGFEASQ